MRRKRKLKQKEKAATTFTIQDFVDEAVDSFGAKLEKVLAEAKEGGEHGVMIVATEDAFVCDLVPFGRVWRAGSYDAVHKLRAKMEQEK